jgi:hypothetical protein
MADTVREPADDDSLHGVDAEGVWSAIRASLTGRRLDYTRGPIGRSILLLSVPMVLEMMMESLFAVTDTYFVGKLGTDAVAAVGLTASLVTVVFCLASGSRWQLRPWWHAASVPRTWPEPMWSPCSA